MITHKLYKRIKLKRSISFSNNPNNYNNKISLPGTIKWSLLSKNERHVWELLDLNEKSWDNDTSNSNILISNLKWDSLNTTQKSAIQYGLLLTPQQWNHLISNSILSNSSNNDIVANNIKKENKNVVSYMKKISLQMGWNMVKLISPLTHFIDKKKIPSSVNLLLLVAKQIPTLIESLSNKIELTDNSIETVLYLDDSGSMKNFGLSKGKDILYEISHMIQNNTRIIKFGFTKTLLFPRDRNWSFPLVALNWDASSGGTNMWEMIESDIKNRYIPNNNCSGKLRVIVITDGMDTSFGKYNGINGMDPMMKELLISGYDIEFHIIFIRDTNNLFSIVHSHDAAVLKRYECLTKATGGSFLLLEGCGFTNYKSKNIQNFLSNLTFSNQMNEEARQIRMNKKKHYRLGVNNGENVKFDWLKLLP